MINIYSIAQQLPVYLPSRLLLLHHIIQGPAHPIEELKQRVGKEQMCNVEVGQPGWSLEMVVVIRTKAGQEREGNNPRSI